MYNSEVSRGGIFFRTPADKHFIGVQKLNFDNFTKFKFKNFFCKNWEVCVKFGHKF